MSVPDIETIKRNYRAGFFPDCSGTRFSWRLDSSVDRYVIRVTAEAAAKAERIIRREEKQFRITRDRHFEAVLEHLMDETIRPETWLKEPVAEIYRVLHAAGLVKTYEGCDPGTGRLAGGLLGVHFGRVFSAETMFQLVGGASKTCLCRLMIDLHAKGCELIDVQNRHEDPAHPARRFEEQQWNRGWTRMHADKN